MFLLVPAHPGSPRTKDRKMVVVIVVYMQALTLQQVKYLSY